MKPSSRLRSWLYVGLTLVVVAYLVAAWMISSSASSDRLCEGVLITVHDTADIHFVTPHELSAELGDLPLTARSTRLADIDVDSLERMLDLFDKIEKVNVDILTNGKLLIDVWPMRPVARIFDSAGLSYYINRAGKRIAAEPGYFLDVPVIRGDFSAEFPATSLLPLLDYLATDPDWAEAISMIDARSPSDIILVPVIRGHVINIGDTTDFADKFRRLRLMYAKVMSAKGWDFYKELSVKWRGQVVGIRRNAKLPEPEYVIDEQNEEEANISTVELDEGAPVKVSTEKPIPTDNPRSTTPSAATATQKPDSAKETRPKKTDKESTTKPKTKQKTT